MRLIIYSVLSISSFALSQRPNIVIIVADDLGWNDVGFHGSNQIPTPNIDALAYSGVILNNYYVAPICTPSRSALMTGRDPIHTGMQHSVLYGQEPRGLPLTEKLLPQYLKELNYSTHAVGKWHLGFYRKEYLPTSRGFDSHMGFWTGHQDYFDHTAMEVGQWGLDMRLGEEPAKNLHGQYVTSLYTNEAVKIISQHNQTNPLFLYLAHAAVHSGNPYNPLPALDDDVAAFKIHNFQRRKFAAMLKRLDDSVGKVTHALWSANMLENTIIVFTTDNGGPSAGFNLNAASNWPLRGVKNTLWEGGVRGVGFVWSSQLQSPARVSDRLFHITDWLPSLLHVAGYKKELPSKIDGVDNWPSISNDEASRRDRILHNIDDIWGSAALTIGDWKIIKGANYKGWDRWYGPSGRDNHLNYDTELIRNSPSGIALQNIGKPLYDKQIFSLRVQAEVSCGVAKNSVKCHPTQSSCLFNIKTDPCEFDNVALMYPSILERLEKELETANASAVVPGNLPLDPAGAPDKWDYMWTNFGDTHPNVSVEDSDENSLGRNAMPVAITNESTSQSDKDLLGEAIQEKEYILTAFQGWEPETEIYQMKTYNDDEYHPYQISMGVNSDAVPEDSTVR